MSESETDPNAETDSESEQETQEYQVLHTPVGDTQPGETIELTSEVAAAFEDNLHPAGEDPPEQEGIRSQVVGQSNGPETLADQDGPIEAGEYEVYRVPIGDTEPGKVEHFEADVARAFADNLLPVDEDADDGTDDEDVADVGAEAEAETEGADVTEDGDNDDEKSFDSPEEFLDQTVTEIRDDLEAADLTDEQLETLRETEVSGDDRTGVKNTIDDHLDE